jgi:hypothetical protein
VTALGVLVVAAGVALVWGGITDNPILPEIRAALGNAKPAGRGARGKGKP